MEPRGALGDYSAADESFTLYTSTQNPHGVRSMLAQAVLHIPESRLRVVAHDVGGGFGMKGDVYPEEALVLLASRHCGRPVKWIATRSESFLTDDFGRDQVIEAEMALDAQGRILGLRSTALHNFGAYVVGAACVPLVFAMRLMPGVYDIPALHVAGRAIFTNTTPTGPYRGAGRPEAAYIIERLMDLAAEKTGLDPLELRRRNYIPPGKFPYKTATGNVFDSGEFLQTHDMTVALADWAGYDARVKQSQADGKLGGRALIYYIEDAGIFNERMELRFDPGGTVTIVAGTFSHGQSHATTYAQLVTQWLGVPFEAILFVQRDTDQVPFGRGTYAARSSMLGGCALKAAADAVVEKAKPMAATLMEAAAGDVEFKDGQFRIVGTDKSMSMMDVAKAFYYRMGVTDKFGVGLEGSGTYATDPPNFPNGCHCCEVEVDMDTGEVRLDRYFAVDDVGLAINPLIC